MDILFNLPPSITNPLLIHGVVVMRLLNTLSVCCCLGLLTACGGGSSSSPSSAGAEQVVSSLGISSAINSSAVSSSAFSENLSSFSSSSFSSQSADLPTTLGNALIDRTIDRVTSTLASGTHKEEGVLRVHYGANDTLTGDSLLLDASNMAASYTLIHDVPNKKIEVTSQLLTQPATQIVDVYQFETPTTGIWTQNYGAGSVLLEGHFTLQHSEYLGFAPLNLVGRRVSLTFLKTVTNLPASTYINSGTAHHLYTTATSFRTDLASLGLSDTEGTYTYERFAINNARDRGFNTTYNAPYQIDFEFKNLTSGIFKENWNNGQILWEGTFVLAPIE